MNNIYIVCFYTSETGPSEVKIAGCYLEAEKANNRLKQLVGCNISKSNDNKIIYNNGICGWINKYSIGDNDNFKFNINQPHII